MLFLSETDVKKCLSMSGYIEANRRALASIVEGGGGVVPTRLGLQYFGGSTSSSSSAAAEDWTLFKPAALYDNDDKSTLMGIKVVGVRAENPSRGLPLVPATVVTTNAATGMVDAVMGGTYLTGARTAAGSAISTGCCKSVVETLVVVGAGLQAELHIEAIRCVHPEVSRVIVINRSAERAEQLVASLDDVPTTEVVLLSDTEAVQRAVGQADVLSCCTNTTTPLFRGSWVKPGCHITGVGSYTPKMQEVDKELVERCRILLDTPEAMSVGDLKHLPAKHPATLLGNILLDESSMPSPTSDLVDCTFYKSVGTAIQDVVTANAIVQQAREMGIGTEVDMT